MDQAAYGLVSKRAHKEERTPIERPGQGDEEELRRGSLEESSIGKERVETDGTSTLFSLVARGQEETGKRSGSIEATLAEKIASLLEGEVRSKEDLAHKTLQIITQKDIELAGLNEKIRLLESFNNVKGGTNSLDGGTYMPPIVFTNKHEFNLRIEEDDESKSGLVTPDCEDSTNSETPEEKCDTKEKLMKDDVQAIGDFPKNGLQHLHLLNTKLLSAIYKDSQIRKDEQNNFMKIISQLSDVVKELRDQNSINSVIKKSNDLVLEPPALTIECQYGTSVSPGSSPCRTNAERDCDVSPNSLDLKDVQNLMSAWDQASNISKADSNQTSVPDSAQSTTSVYYQKSERNLKFTREKNKTMTKKLQNKIMQDKLKNISLKLRNQGKCLGKTRGVLKQFQEQGKSITSVVEDIKLDQEKEKFVLESLMDRIEKLSKNDELVREQSGEIKDLDERISRIESRLFENNGYTFHKDREISNLIEELKQANIIKDEYQAKNNQLNKEISDCFIRLASSKKQIEELKESLRKERALNDSIKQNYEINLRNVVSNAVQEQKKVIQEIKMSFDSNIAALQTENSDLKTRIYQLEEDGKKICNDSKIRVVKAKKQLYSQASIASQKLLKADGKIKEFYYTIEKLLKGIYHRLYEAELEQIKRKCHEEGGVQTASYILGVSATQMSKVLAAGSVPSLHDWMECCKRLVYKEKFAEDLSAFIFSLFRPILPKDVVKGIGDTS